MLMKRRIPIICSQIQGFEQITCDNLQEGHESSCLLTAGSLRIRTADESVRYADMFYPKDSTTVRTAELQSTACVKSQDCHKGGNYCESGLEEMTDTGYGE